MYGKVLFCSGLLDYREGYIGHHLREIHLLYTPGAGGREGGYRYWEGLMMMYSFCFLIYRFSFSVFWALWFGGFGGLEFGFWLGLSSRDRVGGSFSWGFLGSGMDMDTGVLEHVRMPDVQYERVHIIPGWDMLMINGKINTDRITNNCYVR